ncbi:SemiSWEET transporter [Kordiimonas laminariae]|uniref:SemiSWEET transporter n=1 Tax=Kordiimonas laminariae TaxID=2917717 RepID=UPI001FF511ED|nr:SemiSWEET transporter [Kordiimonas laminariae]MCK0069631.1 SemiSWEET transporter [Kordiimonas laminariae]
MPLSIELIGYVAAFLTSFAFLPQALMVWRTNDTKSISLGMYSLFTLGVALWLTYGFMLMSYPLIAANSFTLILASSILVKKINNTRRGEG